jgi:catechol 2,3-dioxygenase-like lactoylglutathione lyase family enzyme
MNLSSGVSLAALALAALALVPQERAPMQLGAFSVSLAVEDIAASRAFYEKLGFSEAGGKQEQNWLILRNGTTTIGLFQGMFEKNLLTFNPGWDAQARPLASFEDVRDLQRRLEAAGLEPVQRADEDSTGPASLVLVDPDGNTVLLDQHVPRPAADGDR